MRDGFPSIATGLLLLMSLSTIFVLPIEPIAESFDDGLSEEQEWALEELPTSVKVTGRSDNSTTSPWGWAVSAGGSSSEWASGIAVDSSGNAYVTGYFQETAAFGSTSLLSSGGNDIFIAKLSSSGSWQWAIMAGNSSDDSGNGIAVDSSGNAYVTGYFQETAAFGSTSLTSDGSSDIFIAKLSSSGSWQWAVRAGSSDNDGGNRIVVDSNGNAYVTGYFQETAAFGNISLTSDGSYDIFIAKLSSSGSWQWAVKAGGSSADVSNGIAVDSSGNAYVTGGFQGTAAFGSISLTSDGSRDIFIAKLSSSGSWQWAVKAGSSEYDSGNGIAVDSSGNAYVAGYFQETAAFGNIILTSDGSYDIFIAKLSSSGSWQWAVKAGGSSSEGSNGIAVDSSGNAYVIGGFQGTVAFGSISLTSDGSSDIFIAKLSSSGSWQWAVRAGGSSAEGPNGMAIDSSGNAYITGIFTGTTTFGNTSLMSSGFYDIFIAKLSSSGSSEWAVKADSSSGGLSGFEPLYLAISIFLASIVIGRNED